MRCSVCAGRSLKRLARCWADWSRGNPFGIFAIGRLQSLRCHGVDFLPTVPYQQVAAEITRHRIGWLPCYVPNHQFCVPTKLLEYMAFGLPVVASAFDEVSRIIRENDCGILVPWDEPEAHAAALQHLLTHPEERGAWARTGVAPFSPRSTGNASGFIVEFLRTVAEKMGLHARTAPRHALHNNCTRRSAGNVVKGPCEPRTTEAVVSVMETDCRPPNLQV